MRKPVATSMKVLSWQSILLFATSLILAAVVLSNAIRNRFKKVCEVEKRVYFCTRKSELMSSAEEQLIGLEKVFRGLKKLQK